MRFLIPFGLAITVVATPAAASDKFFSTFADVGAIGIPVAAGVVTLVEHDRNGLIQGAETGVAAMLTTTALKYALDTQRPNGGRHSFPSGHATLAFSGAGYLHARYGWKVGLPFELLAAGVAYSRVRTRDHHWYDVVAGAAIGEGSAFLLTSRLSDNVRVGIGGDSKSGAISFAARF